jgi:hypothetical protein
MSFIESVGHVSLAIPSFFWQALPYAGAAGGVAAGAVIAQGLWGARRGWQPVCARCGHDLRGADPAAGGCPECGADLSRTGAVLAGVRRARPRMVAMGVLLLIAAGFAQHWLRSADALRAAAARHAPAAALLHAACSDGASREFFEQVLLSRVRDGRRAGDGTGTPGLLDAVVVLISRDPSERGPSAANASKRLASGVIAALTTQEVDSLALRAAEELLASNGDRQRIVDFVARADDGMTQQAGDFRMRVAGELAKTDAGRVLLAPRAQVVGTVEAGSRMTVRFQPLLAPQSARRGLPNDRNSTHAIVVDRTVAVGADGVRRELRPAPPERPFGDDRDGLAHEVLADLPPGEYVVEVTGVLAPAVLVTPNDPFGDSPGMSATDAARLDGAAPYSSRTTIMVAAPKPPILEFATDPKVIDLVGKWFGELRFGVREGIGTSVNLELRGAPPDAVSELILAFAVEVRQGDVRRDAGAFRRYRGGWYTSGMQVPRGIDLGQPLQVVLSPSTGSSLRDESRNDNAWNAPLAWARFTLDFASATATPAVRAETLPLPPATPMPIAREEAEPMLRDYAASLLSHTALPTGSRVPREFRLRPMVVGSGEPAGMPPLCGRLELLVEGVLVAPVVRVCVPAAGSSQESRISLPIGVRDGESIDDQVVVVRYTPEPEFGAAIMGGEMRYIAQRFELRSGKGRRPELVMLDE